MKKFITLTIAAAMLFAMAGCQSAKDEVKNAENDVKQAVETAEDDVKQAVETAEDDVKKVESKVEAEAVEIEQEVKDKLNQEIIEIPQDAELAREKAMEAVTTVEEKLGIKINRETTAETINGAWKAYAIFNDAKYITLSSFGVEAVDLYINTDSGEASLVYDIGDEEPVAKGGSFEITGGVAVFDGDLAGMIAYIDQSDPDTLMIISAMEGSNQMFMLSK